MDHNRLGSRSVCHPPAVQEDAMRLVLCVGRILLSRAMRGNYVWFEDSETRERVAGLLGSHTSR